MRLKYSVFYLFLFLQLMSCGKEEFGSTPRTSSSQAEAVTQFQQSFCAIPTEIAPKVDILYLVDNSQSTYYLANDIKVAIRNMVNSISKDFDYRVVGTSLIGTDATPFDDYQVLTNSQDSLSTEASSKKIISSSELNFFSTAPASGALEAGLKRSIDFISANVTNNSGLFREGANLLIIIFSNGRDTDLETKAAWDGGGSTFNSTVYAERLASFNSIKTSLLSLKQLRLISTTAHSSCKSGWFSSEQSYVKMSKELYNLAGATDAPSAQDSYDLCDGISNIFAPVNESIKKVILQNTYRYWPITFATDSNVRNDFGDILVYKTQNGTSTLIPSTGWTYYEHKVSADLNLREPPSEGGESSGKHFIRFNDDYLITSPTCVQVKSSTRTEYFGYIVLNQEPKPETIVVRIGDKLIPKSDSDGWTYVGSRMNQNIKMPHPKSGDELPAVNKSGFMIKLNGSGNYFRSGDSVEVNYIAAPI